MTDTPSPQGGQSQPGGGQPPGGAAPTGGMPIEQIDRAQQDRRENPNAAGHSPALDARKAAASRQQGQQQQDQQEGQQQQTPGGKIKVGDVELTDTELKEIMKFKGESEARKLTLPKDPNAYTLDLPADFKPPEGVKFEFNKSDPVLARARELAFSRGMDQSTFSDFLGIYAANRVAEANTINTARNAEIAKLGTMAPQRIDAIRTWARGMVGDQLGGALEQMLVTSKHVEAFEKIIDKFSRQGGTPYSQAHREGEPPAGTIPGYANMSFEQKRAAQMSQNPQAPRTYRER
jgi:hypothetical protein